MVCKVSTVHNIGDRARGHQLEEALTFLRRVVLDGLQHGHFECSVSCSLGKGGRRDVVIRAGKSERFTIPKEELPHL